MESLGSTLTSGLTSLGNTLVNWLSNVKDAVVSLGTTLGNVFATVGNTIKDAVVSLGSTLGNIFTTVGNTIKNAIETLGNFIINGLKSLFIPSDDFLTNRVNSIKAKFQFSENIVNTVDSLFNRLTTSTMASGGDAPCISLDINIRGTVKRVKVIDMFWYAPYKAYGDALLSGIILVTFIWSVFRRLPSIIHGDSSYSEV